MKSKLSELIPLIALAAAISLTAAAACGGSDAEGRAAQEGATAAPATEPGASVNAHVPEEIESAARRLLAGELDADEGDFRLDSAEGAGWPDASLGCPKEGYAYAQVLTPGYKLVFGRAGTSYAVHTNADGSHMVICGDGP